METVAISEFRSNMPTFLEKVEAGETLRLTSRGKEIARVIPPSKTQAEARGELANLRKTAWIGDVISPISEEWDAVQ